MTVSLAMLVLDPPVDRMAALVEAVRPVVSDVVIVVDDRTREGAVEAMSTWRDVTLVPFRWVDDFAAARNAALPHCTGDWILHLDPDELPSHAMLDFIAAVDASPWIAETEWFGQRHPDPRGYLFWTQTFVGGRLVEGSEQDWHCRLFRRERGYWYKAVHEQVMLDEMMEGGTRGTPLLPKAPRSAALIHSKTDPPAKLALYRSIESAVPA